MEKNSKEQLEKPISIHHKKEKLEADSSPINIGIADFIQENISPIVKEWEVFAKTLLPASNNMTPLALRNHIHEILAFIVEDIKSPQTNLEQVQKSQGEKERLDASPTAAETHAALRLAGGFEIDQMVSEWRALRASVIKLWSKASANSQMSIDDLIELTRFNESIDQELAESVSHYTKKVSYGKDLFIGVLSHDLRTPLSVILMSAQLQLSLGAKDKLSMLAAQIHESASRVIKIVDDLLEVTRARFGSGFPVVKAPMDMGFVCRQITDEMRIFYPERTILLEVSGEDLHGEWDKARIGQLFSNLIGNAMQYSFRDTPVRITLKGTKENIFLTVHNEGIPIPKDKIGTLFDSFTSGVEGDHPSQFHLGLGLYITKEIVVAHGGTIDVSSSEEEGTTFTVKIPKVFELQSDA